MIRVSQDILLKKIGEKLEQVGVIPSQALEVAKILVYADSAGITSHGSIRLEHYLSRIKLGGITLNESFNYQPGNFPWASLLDGKGGLGHVLGSMALEKAMHLADEHGLGLVSVKNASHYGPLSYFIREITQKGYIAIMMGNSDSCVVPTHGKTPFLGSNPLAFGFPSETQDEPVIIDFSTSEVSLGAILTARDSGTDIPATWAVDEAGNSTTNPHQATSLLPMAGHKGYALGFLVETLVAILTGSAFGPHVVPMYKNLDKTRNLSLFFLVMKPNIHLPVGGFEQGLSAMVKELRAQVPLNSEKPILTPGEPEYKKLKETAEKGVEILESVYNFLWP